MHGVKNGMTWQGEHNSLGCEFSQTLRRKYLQVCSKQDPRVAFVFPTLLGACLGHLLLQAEDQGCGDT